MANAARFDFGISYQMKQPVTAIIAERFPATLELAFAAALFAVALGIPMGVYTGIHRDSWLSKVFLTVSLIGISLPTFLIGILLIYVFAVKLGVLPSFGRGEVVRIGFWRTGLLTASGLKALILPAITLGLFQMTLVTRLVRSEMLEVLRTDYIKFARARGLPERAINFGHALQEHAGAGDHRDRPAARRHHRLRHHHRDGIPMAGHGADVHPGRAERRHPGDGGLPACWWRSCSCSSTSSSICIYVRVDPRIRIFGRGVEEPMNDVPERIARSLPLRRRPPATGRGARRQPAGRLPRQRSVAQLPALQARRRGGAADAWRSWARRSWRR